MFSIPEVLKQRGNSELKHCWLAGTLSEKMFKKAVRPYQLAETNIGASCNEILRVTSNDNTEKDQTAHCNLNVTSNLMLGVVKLFDYQVSQCEDELFKDIEALIAEDDEIRSKLPKKQKEPIVEPITEDIPDILTPLLDLDRPFPPDQNLLQLTPVIPVELNEKHDSDLLPVPSLTYNELEAWMRDEGSLWPGTEIQLPEWLQTDNTQLDNIFGEEAAALDLPTRVASPKRLTRTSKVDSPSMQLRETLRSKIDKLRDERTEEQGANIPMEIDEISILPEDNFEAPAHSVALEASAVPEEIEAFAAPADPENFVTSVAPETFVTSVAPETFVAPADAETLVTPSARRSPLEDLFVIPARRARTRRGKIIDGKQSLTSAQKDRWRDMIDAHCVPPAKTKSMVRVPPNKEQPSKIFKFGTEHRHGFKIQEFAFDLMNRFLIGTCGMFSLEDENMRVIRVRSPAIPELMEFTEAIADAVDRFTEINVDEQTVDVPQPQVFDEPALIPKSVSSAEILLADVEDARPTENTSEANTISIGQMRISDDPTVSNENLDEFLPMPRPAKMPRMEKQIGQQKSSSSGQVIVNIDGETSSPSTSNTPPGKYTKKDLFACLEVLWHDHSIVGFKELVPPETSTDKDVVAAFGLILELFSEDKLDLTQPEQHGELYMEKIAQSESMD